MLLPRLSVLVTTVLKPVDSEPIPVEVDVESEVSCEKFTASVPFVPRAKFTILLLSTDVFEPESVIPLGPYSKAPPGPAIDVPKNKEAALPPIVWL